LPIPYFTHHASRITHHASRITHHVKIMSPITNPQSPISPITGREPQLSAGHVQHGRRLSLRSLATTLQLLPPGAISLEASAELLRSPDFYVRYSTAERLCQRGDREARLVLQEVLTNGDGPTRASVARHLHHLSWFAAEPLLRQALSDTDSRVHESAVYALCNLRHLSAYELLVQTLPQENDEVKQAAAWALDDSRDPAAVPVLALTLQAADPTVRAKSLEALGATESATAFPLVRHATHDPEPDVVYAAVLSLLELAGDNGLNEAATLIANSSGRQRQAILRAFFHASNYLHLDIGRHPATPTLFNALELALQDPDPAVRLAAAWPLAWLDHPRAAAILDHFTAAEPDETIKTELTHIRASFHGAAFSSPSQGEGLGERV
jgi:HEAT repeat protein